MATRHPTIGAWYENLGEGVTFQVTSLDNRRGILRLRDSEGSTQEISLKDWGTLEVEPIEAPDHILEPLDEDEYPDLELSDRGEEWTEYQAASDEY